MEFTEFVTAHRPSLMRFATVLTGQAWLAGDIVSNVLGRAFERWERIGAVDLPAAYVRRMIVNEYLSWRRHLQRTAPVADIEATLPLEPDSADERAERDAMRARLATLPRKQRAALVLRYYAGMPDAEIAVELGCSVSTVRSQISRALATLRIAAAPHPDLLPLEA